VIYYCRPSKRPALIGLIIIAAPILRYALSLYAPGNQLAAYTLTPCRWDGLFLGVLGADVIRRPGVRAWFTENRWFLRTALVMLGGLLAIFLHRAAWHPDSAARESGFTWIALFALVLLLAALHDPHVGWLFRWRPLLLLGTISYGVYLMHPAILW